MRTVNPKVLKQNLFKPVRALVDPVNEAIIEDWARLEGRSFQMHAGMLLRQIAALYKDDPQKLKDLGLMAGLTSSLG